MKTFVTYLEEEPKKGEVGPAEMEQHIVIAYNGGFDKAPDTFKIKKVKYEKNKHISESIASEIRKKTKAPKGSMIHFGKGNGKTIDWWIGNATPKTDLFSTSGVNISLKKAGGSQLMSGLVDETRSTFKAAVNFMGKKAPKKEIDILLQDIDTRLKKIFIQGNINSMVKAVKTKVIPDTITARAGSEKSPFATIKVNRKKYEQEMKNFINWKEILKETEIIFTDFFEKNETFKKWFVFEAATGNTKFRPDPNAQASWVVKYNPETGKNNLIEELSIGRKTPSKFISQLTKIAKIRVGPKTSTGSRMNAKFQGTSSGAVRLDVKESEETLFDYFKESFDDFTNRLLLNEEYLTELEIIKAVKNWIISFIKNISVKLREMANKGLQFLMDFLEFEPKTVNTSGLSLFGFK